MFRKILNTRYINILVLLSAVDVNQNIYTLWSRSCYLTALILYPMGTMYISKWIYKVQRDICIYSF